MKLIGVGVEIYFEKENIYSFDSKMELVLTMLSSIAQEESINISENSKWGIKKRFKDGVAIVNCERFMGYNKDENGHLIFNEEEPRLSVEYTGNILMEKDTLQLLEDLLETEFQPQQGKISGGILPLAVFY